MEAGDDTLNITGSTAVVTGEMDGGTGGETAGDVLNVDLGAAASTFAAGGKISNFEQVKIVSGRTTLTAGNTYAGTTEVGGGAIAARLQLDGTHEGGGNYAVKTNGTLAGKGGLTLAAAGNTLTVDAGGVLAPGEEAAAGRLTLALGSVQVNGALAFRLDGTVAGVAGGYDQLTLGATIGGTFTLDGASLLTIDVNFTPVYGEKFTLVDLANGATPVAGTFAGLEEGERFTSDGQDFTISYEGGSGNDVVVTAVPEPGTWSAVLTGVGFLGWVMRLRRRS